MSRSGRRDEVFRDLKGMGAERATDPKPVRKKGDPDALLKAARMHTAARLLERVPGGLFVELAHTRGAETTGDIDILQPNGD